MACKQASPTGSAAVKATATSVVGDAVGVPRRRWFVAVVKNNTEKVAAEKLTATGATCYLPVQEEIRVWRNGRRKKIERVVISSTVFVYCTEGERREIVKLPYINRFMTDKTRLNASGVGHPPAVIPERQIQTLRFMLGNSDSPVSVTADFRKGEMVRVVRGSLRGLEGEILESESGSELLVRIDIFGCARVTISPTDVERIRTV